MEENQDVAESADMKYEVSYKYSRTPRIPLLKRWNDKEEYISLEDAINGVEKFSAHGYWRLVNVHGNLVKKLTFEDMPLDWGCEDYRWIRYNDRDPMYRSYWHVKIKPIPYVKMDNFQRGN
jgi:hypothetical protein